MTRLHTGGSISFANPMPLTVGWRMLSVHVSGADIATRPDASLALLALEQVTR